MRIVVHGGHALQGTFRASGNSNAALALTAAALLTDQVVTLHNVPDTLSTGLMLEAAQALGATITREGSRVALQTPTILTRDLDVGQQASTLLFLAPILARRRHARIEIDFPASQLYSRLVALRDLDINVHLRGNILDFEANPWEERTITLVETSVTTTALVSMLAAVLGKRTEIYNAASEPHIQDLHHLLVQMGARIEGIGSNRLIIHGTETPGGGELQLAPDHIEIASIVAIGALTHGTLTVEGVRPDHLGIITRVYGRLGINTFLNGDSLFLPVHETLVASQRAEEIDVPIDTAPWPGFPSDLVAMTTVVATQTRGTTLIHEKLYNNRLLFVDKLTAMGAQIVLCDPHRALVVGPSPLHSEYMDTPDVRTGLALLGAALCTNGSVTIDSAELIDRTFENVVQRLVELGAQIEVVIP